MAGQPALAHEQAHVCIAGKCVVSSAAVALQFATTKFIIHALLLQPCRPMLQCRAVLPCAVSCRHHHQQQQAAGSQMVLAAVQQQQQQLEGVLRSLALLGLTRRATGALLVALLSLLLPLTTATLMMTSWLTLI
jgi:hypothetical protein